MSMGQGRFRLSALLALAALAFTGCQEPEGEPVPPEKPVLTPKPVAARSLDFLGKEDTPLQADLSALYPADSGYPLFTLSILDTSRRWASPSLEGRALQVVPTPEFAGLFRVRLEVLDSAGQRYLDSSGVPVLVTVYVSFLPVNDPPRIVRTQADTAFHCLDTLRLNFNSLFSDVDDRVLRYTVSASQSAFSLSVVDSIGVFALGDSVGPVPVRIRAADSAGDSAAFTFRLGAGAPARTGVRYPLPLRKVGFADIRPDVQQEQSARNTLMLLSSGRFLFLDSRGRLMHRPRPYRPLIAAPEAGFTDHTLYFRVGTSPLDSMKWMAISDMGIAEGGFGFDPGPRGYVPVNAYAPVESARPPGSLWVHWQSEAYSQPPRRFSLARQSGGSVTEGAALAIPADAHLLKALRFGNGIAVIWRRTIDTLQSSELGIGLFAEDGTAIAPTRTLTTYLPGSQPKYSTNTRALLGAMVIDGRLEILHSTANILTPTPGGGAVGAIDQALFRTVIDVSGALVLDSHAITGVAPEGYASLYPIQWQSIGTSSYRVYWAGFNYAGTYSYAGSVLVDAAANLYQNPTRNGTENLTVEYRFADGGAFRYSAGAPSDSGEFITGP